MPPPDGLLPLEAVNALNQPVQNAVGFPRQAYTDAAFLDLERKFVFDASWVFVAAGGSIPDPGDVLPFDLIGRPVAIVRQRDGSIKAFHNVCRHRGVILIEQAVRHRLTLVCPYHAWSYGLDGTLLKAPHFAGDGNSDTGVIPRDCLDLKAIRCEAWQGLVFLNMSNDAPPLSEHMAPVAPRYGDLDFSEMRLGATQEYRLACNWKLAIENF